MSAAPQQTGSNWLNALPRPLRQLAASPIARGSAISLGIRISGMVLLFLQTLLLTRLLGAEEFGRFALALSIAQIAATISIFGLGRFAVREIPALLAENKHEVVRGFCRSSMLLILALSLIAMGVIAIGAPLFAARYSQVILAGLAIIPALALIQLLRGLAQGFSHVGMAQIPSDILRPLLLIGALALLYFTSVKADASNILNLYAITAGLTALAGFFALRRIIPQDRNFTQLPVKRWAKESLPFLGIGTLAIFMAEANTLWLGALSDAKQAGLFQPFARITALMTLVLPAANMMFAPKIAGLHAEGKQQEMTRLIRSFRLATVIIVALSSLTIAALGPYILAMFGAEFTAIASALWLVAAAQIFFAGCGPNDVLLSMRGRAGSALIGQAIALAASSAICIIFIPTYGALAATWAMATGIAFWGLSTWVMVKMTSSSQSRSQGISNDG